MSAVLNMICTKS